MPLQDAETVAAGIAETSGGNIKTGIYHSDVGDKEKETLHKRWRKGEIQVVCATIGEPFPLLGTFFWSKTDLGSPV
jgi:superfamily II DNA helicase RecQ